ncbi:hypothetical protein MAR_031260, partial [Mya arenaria]
TCAQIPDECQGCGCCAYGNYRKCDNNGYCNNGCQDGYWEWGIFHTKMDNVKPAVRNASTMNAIRLREDVFKDALKGTGIRHVTKSVIQNVYLAIKQMDRASQAEHANGVSDNLNSVIIIEYPNHQSQPTDRFCKKMTPLLTADDLEIGKI